MYQSIVWFHEKEQKKANVRMQCVEDLNLDQVISFINRHYERYHLDSFYHSLPKEHTRSLRQEVLMDFCNSKVFDQIKDFLSSYQMLKERLEYEQQCKYRYQRMKLSMDNCAFYCDMMRRLELCLNEESVKSQGLKSLLLWLREEVFQKDYLSIEQQVKQLEDEFDHLTFSLCYEGMKLSGRQGIPKEKKGIVRLILDQEKNKVHKSYQNTIKEKLGLSELEVIQENPPFVDTKEMNELERNIVKLLRKQCPEPFEKLEDLWKNPPNIYREEIEELVREVAFYLSYLEFVSYMEHFGYQFSHPVISNDEFGIVNGYDLALAIQAIKGEKKVVPNSCDYYGKERFFVVTGPNQGGKTTFARMLGQEVYFAQLGLMVPATAATIPGFRQIFSHFAMEEAEEIGAGKLKEELLRLKPILNQIQKVEDHRTFIIINELFTTAATYDAAIMGHKVMDYLCQANCYGVYVTHVRELAEGKEEAVSLVAEVEDDECRTRTYRMTRRPSQSGQAQSVAYKYGLTYDQMRRRIPK